MQLNYDDPISILEDIYWVGFLEEETNLHCNPYLLIDGDEALVIDPGSIPDFPKIMRKIIEAVSPEKISYLVLSHQDPDVCGNIGIMEEVIGTGSLQIAAHINTVRLVRHYGVRSPFYIVDRNEYKLILKSGREIRFLFVPFLHSPGAIMTYDTKSETLFSGDIFGGISKDWNLFADDGFLGAMKDFHQAYMPSNSILRECMERVERLNPKRILPQHGSVIHGENVSKAVQFLKELPCAFDLAQNMGR